MQGNTDALEKHSGYLDIRDHNGASPLHYAASKGHLCTIRFIVMITGQQGDSTTHFTLKYCFVKYQIKKKWNAECELVGLELANIYLINVISF